MEPNQDLNKIIGNAFQTAIAKKHEYVTSEHLTLSLISHEDVIRKLLPLEINIEEIVSIIRNYIITINLTYQRIIMIFIIKQICIYISTLVINMTFFYFHAY